MLGFIADIWGCVSDPLACAVEAAEAVPTHWWFWTGLVIGLILGAIFDWWALVLIVVVALLELLPRKREDNDQLDLPFEDKQPAPRRRAPTKKRPLITDWLKRKKS